MAVLFLTTSPGSDRFFETPQVQKKLLGMVRKRKKTAAMTLTAFFGCCLTTLAQQPAYPKEMRGYKVERATVELKKPEKKTKQDNSTDLIAADPAAEGLIQYGNPEVARVTPLGISLEIPIVVATVRQKGHVDFLVFEDMFVNDTSVEIDEYHRGFDLPNTKPLTLSEPVRFYIYLPRALLVAVDEWSDSKKTWLVQGRVYVFGRFKKGFLSFKRCIPVELKITMPNPLHN